MRKIISIALTILALSVVGFLVLNKYIYTEKQGDGTEITQYEGTLTGEHVCLPHKDKDGPQTLECAYGLRTDAGEYYALDLEDESLPDLGVGERFTATGLITPITTANDNRWNKYAIVGIFSVTGAIKPL